MNIILFDGICNLCNGTVSFLIKHDSQNVLHFSAQQSPNGNKIMQQYGIEEGNKSVIFIKDNTVFYKSDAIIQIAKHLTGWPSLLQFGQYIPKAIRNGIYDLIANNRYRLFGKRTTCSVPNATNMHKFH